MTITVDCPSCTTTFPVAPHKVPEGGVHARCSACSSVFFVDKPQQFEDRTAEREPTPNDVSMPASDARSRGETEAPVASAPRAGTSEREPPAAGRAEQAEPARAVNEDVDAGTTGPAARDTPEAGQAPDALEEAPRPPSGFRFGHRDPHEKARRLARVLVSDMIMYNPERHERATEAGTLKDDFEEEIGKSWEEYVEQVGTEIAEDESYFRDALNQILAKGEDVFTDEDVRQARDATGTADEQPGPAG